MTLGTARNSGGREGYEMEKGYPLNPHAYPGTTACVQVAVGYLQLKKNAEDAYTAGSACASMIEIDLKCKLAGGKCSSTRGVLVKQ